MWSEIKRSLGGALVFNDCTKDVNEFGAWSSRGLWQDGEKAEVLSSLRYWFDRLGCLSCQVIAFLVFKILPVP